MNNQLSTKIVAQIAGISLIAGLVGGAVYGRIQSTGSSASMPSKIVEERHYVEESETIDAIQKVVPAVLSIVATKDLRVFQQQPFDPFMFFENDPFLRDFGLQFQRPQQQQQNQEQPETKRQQVAGGTGFIIES